MNFHGLHDYPHPLRDGKISNGSSEGGVSACVGLFNPGLVSCKVELIQDTKMK